MPALDWQKFCSLEGSKDRNLENLSRGIIRLQFGRSGQFRALLNQPGVEFYLNLTQSCALGDPPKCIGWQCKFHQRVKGNLTTASRSNIENSLRTTEKHCPEITNWILWTPYTLSKKDQQWFYNLKTKMALDLWTENEFENLLSGNCLFLRNAYFNELVITSQNLADQHRVAVQPILKRWLEPAHQSVESERTIRQMLGEAGSWGELVEVGKSLKEASQIISQNLSIKDPLNDLLKLFIKVCDQFSNILLHFHETLGQGDLDIIRQKLKERKSLINTEICSVPRRLRTKNLPVALTATNALDDMRVAQNLLDQVEEFLEVGLIAILADAGGGKTQMAAELTKPHTYRPAGILLLGRDLHNGQTLNDLAQHFSINGKPVTSGEQMLSALDVAGKRFGCRLPVVIDGLNEAEIPEDWKDLLARLSEVIKKYPNVLIVCTLRTGEHRREDRIPGRISQSNNRESFAVKALPETVRRIESEGFGGDVYEAVQKYFCHYKINPEDSEIPFELFQNPLNLRIYCENINPERKAEVKVEQFPFALPTLLEKYLDSACERISDMPNLSHHYSTEDVKAVLYKFGLDMWENKQHEVKERTFRTAISDIGRPWNRSIINLLAQEGIIFRNPSNEPGEYVIIPAYDALGGYLIASALLIKYSQDMSFEWLNTEETIGSFSGENSHFFAVDIFKALVALVPRRMHGKQLWKEKNNPFPEAALKFMVNVEPENIDNDSVSAMVKFLQEHPEKETKLFSRFQRLRGRTKHRFNAEFVDSVLRTMSIVSRDLNWTEWIRETRRERFNDLLTIEESWKANLEKRTPADRLRAKWIMWLLTSTDRELRDVATRTLYWFGRGNPKALFEESLRALEINDQYVPERMFAASYGVVMALHYEDRSNFNQDILFPFAEQIYKLMFAKEAKYGTTHILLRDYAKHIVDIALLHKPNLFSKNQKDLVSPPFRHGGIRKWGESEDLDDGKYRNGSSPMHMDFENYTLGRLVDDRYNYDFEHSGYKIVKANIFWRIYELGYSHDLFKDIDSQISEDNWRWRKEDHLKLDRYGKKYSWIAFYELAGFRQDNGLLPERYEGRISDTDIDPSFPEEVRSDEIIKNSFLSGGSKSIAKWIESGPMPDLKPYLKQDSISNIKGPWVLLDGFIVQEDAKTKKSIFTFTRGFFVAKNKKRELLKALDILEYPGNDRLPEAEDDYYTFAGEISWCETYPFQKYEKQIEVPTGKKRIIKEKIKSTRDVLVIKWDDKKLKIPNYSKDDIKKGFIEHEEEKILRFNVEVPVRKFCWEGGRSAVNPGHGAYVLTKEICEFLNLSSRPQTFDMHDRSGKVASVMRSFGNLWYNGHKLIYIRRDLLNKYLKEKGLHLFWVIWGERRIRSKDEKELREFAKKNKSYQVYKYVLEF